MTTQQIPQPGTTGKKKTPQIGQQRATPPPVQQDPVWKKAQLGLARIGEKASEAELDEGPTTGSWTTDETSSKYVTNEAGEVTGSSSEREMTAGGGAKQSTKSSARTSDGKTVRDSSSATDALAGVEVGAKLLKKHSAEEISVGIETMARAGLFGEAKKTAAIKRGMASAKYEASAKGGMGLQAKLEAAAKVDRTGAIPALLVTLDAGVKAGIWGEGKFRGTVALGSAELSFLTEVNAMLGAEAKVEAKLFASLKDGVGGELEAEATAGASAKGKVGVELGIPGKAQIELGAEAEVLAGATAKVGAKVRISLSGVSAKFEAEAFAGAKASFSVKGAVKAKGRTIISAKGTIEVSAGVGGKAKGEFTFINGKIKLDAALAGALGIGGGAEVEAEIDVGAIADIIYAQLYEVGASSTDPVVKDVSPDFTRVPLTNAADIAKKKKVGYDAVYDSFVGYARKQAMSSKGLGAAVTFGEGVNRDAEGISRERVQAIIKDVAPLIRADLAYIETDEGIRDAALDAFKGQVSSLIVQHGAIRSWSPVDRVSAAKDRAQIQAEEKMRVARDPLITELDAYCRKQLTAKDGGIKQVTVQEIVGKHYKKLQAVFTGPGEADDVVRWVGEEMERHYLSKFEVKNGSVKIEVDEAKTKATKDGQALKQTNALVAQALDALDGKLSVYVTGLLAKKGASVMAKDLNKEIASATSKITDQLAKPDVNTLVKAKVMENLADLVLNVTMTGGVVGNVASKGNGIEQLRTKRANDAEASARQGAVDKFGKSLGAYRQKKTAKGNAGLKQARVNEMLAAALKGQDAWRTSGDADEAIKATAESALGDDLWGITVVNGVVDTFNFDNAKLDKQKTFNEEHGTSKLGGMDDDNKRRSVVTAAVRGPLQTLCDSFRAESENDSTVRLDTKRLQMIVQKSVEKVRAEAATEVGGDALADAVKLYLPMVKDVKIEALKVTTLVVDNAFYGGLAEAKVVSVAKAAIGAAVKKNAATMTLALANQIVAQYKAKLSSLPADQVDPVLQMVLVDALRGFLTLDNPVVVQGGAVTKLALKQKK